MDETAVLAENYVPAQLKRINLAIPNHFIETPQRPTLDMAIHEFQRTYLRPHDRCQCKTVRPQHTLDGPLVKLVPEVMFALLPQNSRQVQSRITSVDDVSDFAQYLELFSRLLTAEREEILRLYESYSQYAIQLHVPLPRHVPNVAQIFLPGIMDAKPPIHAGDLVLLRPLRNISLRMHEHYFSPPVFAVQFNSQVIGVGRLQNRGTSVIDCTWVDRDLQNDLKKSYREQTFNVRIIPSTSLKEHCCTALQWLSTLPLKVSNQILFPNESPTVHDSDDIEFTSPYVTTLNYKQQMFVRLVRARTQHSSVDLIRPPMILSGPAGTGKTRTMLASIFYVLELSEQHRVLVCTPSHTAADVVTRRLAKKLPKHKLWRLVDSLRPVPNVPSDILQFCLQDTTTGSFTLPMDAASLFSYSVIVCTCSDAHILYKLGFTNELLRARRECFANYAKESLRNLNVKDCVDVDQEEMSRPHFTHLFIDEAAQATEPEVLIPISVVVDPRPNSIKVEIALVGDPRQLAPNIYAKHAAEGGLEKSYMERILQRPMNYLSGGWPYMLGPESDDLPYDMQHQRSCIFLTANYRGHASFLMMPSSMFYYDKLEVVERDIPSWAERLRCVEALSTPVTELAMLWDHCRPSESCLIDPRVLSFRRQLTWPVHFRGVIGQDASVSIENFAGNNWWVNREEADAVLQIVTTLIKDGVLSSSIGIMSPFRGQVVLIRKLLRKENLSGVNVGTVEDYQAVEQDVIILSLTRSNAKFLAHDLRSRVGLFQQVKRANVAMTRAENMFIVVGNPNTMVNDPVWKQWLWFCLRNGLWYGAEIDPQIIDKMQSNPIRVASFREGKKHPLLGSDDETENTILISLLEQNRRSRDE